MYISLAAHKYEKDLRNLLNNIQNEDAKVPEVVVLRLPLYVRELEDMLRSGKIVVSSQQLGQKLQMTPAQIRKDLSYFGKFGKQGRGYPISYLIDQLRNVLGLEREWYCCLIGVGRLGTAVISYPGFTPEGFNIVAAFDASAVEIGKSIGELIVQPMHELESTIKERDISIGIVTVPAEQAQEVINLLVTAGLKSILNYAPVGIQTPAGIQVRNIDPMLSLQSMTYYLK